MITFDDIHKCFLLKFVHTFFVFTLNFQIFQSTHNHGITAVKINITKCLNGGQH